MTRVKICGITSLEDALAACEAGADALGFNFAPEARRKQRYIEPDAARGIIAQLPPYVAAVAILVNEDLDRARSYLSFVDWLQLHGEESVDYAVTIGSRAMKALRVGPDFDPNRAAAWPGSAILLDAWRPGERGGTGGRFDWQVAADMQQRGKDVILAGGLEPQNVADAVRQVRPYAVDTAGGVESAPGKKDHEKLRSFIRNAKTALPLSG